MGISFGEVLPGKPLDSLEFGELESFKDFFLGRDPLFLKGKKEKSFSKMSRPSLIIDRYTTSSGDLFYCIMREYLLLIAEIVRSIAS